MLSTSSSESNIYVPFFSVYYKFYFIFGIVFQTILFVLISKKSPSSLSSLKFFLYNTLISQMVLIFSTFNLQQRTLPGKQTLTILAAGPCQYLGPYFCFSCYHFHMAVTEAVGVAIAITVLFRYLVLVISSISTKQIYMIIMCGYIGPVIVTIIPFTSEWDFELVRNLTRLEHPTYDLSIYGDYPGFINIDNFQFFATNLILGIGVYGAPTAAIFFVRKVLKLLNQHSSMSEKTKKQSKTLIHGLFFQTIIPFFCYIPIFSCYLYTQTTGKEIIIAEHLILALACSPGLIDPLISFYFIVPYRIAIVRFFQKMTNSNQVFVVTNNSMISKSI